MMLKGFAFFLKQGWKYIYLTDCRRAGSVIKLPYCIKEAWQNTVPTMH